MSLVGSIFGSGGASDTQEALNTIKRVPLPVLKEYYPELYKQVVSLNPEMETAVELGPSEMAGIATDPALRSAQLNALNKLQEVGDAGGRDAQFMADQARLETDINTNLKGQNDAIMQNLATRGMAGGGSELVARQMNTQNAANRSAQMGMDLKAQAERRALEALMQSGQLSGQMQQQDFNQQSAKAQAADAINKFNAANKQQVISNNVNATNSAQQWNATNTQNTANQNTQVNNQAQQYNLGLAQKNFDNEMAKATGVAKGHQAVADAKNAERDADMKFIGGMISAGAGAYGGSK